MAKLRERMVDNLAQLPEGLKSLDTADAYEVVISDVLRQLAAQLDRM